MVPLVPFDTRKDKSDKKSIIGVERIYIRSPVLGPFLGRKLSCLFLLVVVHFITLSNFRYPLLAWGSVGHLRVLTTVPFTA